MRTLLLVVFILGLVVVTGKLMYSEAGLVSIHFQGWIIETTPVALLIAAVVAVVSCVLLLKLLALLFNLPTFIWGVGQAGKRARAQKRLLKGFLAFTEGNWQYAAKQLAQPDKSIEISVITCLTAARACHASGDYARRDYHLEQASEIAPQSHTAIDITRAQLQIEQQNYSEALETLVFLRASAPRNAPVIALLARVYQAQQNWEKLDALLPLVPRRKAINSEQLANVKQACWQGLLENSPAGQLPNLYKRLRKHLQHTPELLILLVQRLIGAQQQTLAEKILREQLNQNWREGLITLYAKITPNDPIKQLDQAERWLGAHGRSSELLLTLGELCLRCQLWGKARVYLESSLGISVTPQASLALAELLTQLGETDNARDHYASGLRLALNLQTPAAESAQSPKNPP